MELDKEEVINKVKGQVGIIVMEKNLFFGMVVMDFEVILKEEIWKKLEDLEVGQMDIDMEEQVADIPEEQVEQEDIHLINKVKGVVLM